MSNILKFPTKMYPKDLVVMADKQLMIGATVDSLNYIPVDDIEPYLLKLIKEYVEARKSCESIEQRIKQYKGKNNE